jgi:hypothetical protein
MSGVGVDSAAYLENPGRTRSLLEPSFAVERLYATVWGDPDVKMYSPGAAEQALLDGQNLVVHSGHAANDLLMTEADRSKAFTADRAYALTNKNLPIFLSCGCQAGDFSVMGTAGEKLINAPQGGAIAYLGNVPIGLGIAGGMQMIDEWLRYVQSATDLPLIGDAFVTAHQKLPRTDTFDALGLKIPVIDEASWRWTEKAVVLFGDPMLPVWTQARPNGPTLSAKKNAHGSLSTITFTLTPASAGTITFLADGVLYRLQSDGVTVPTATITANPARITAGFSSTTTQYSFADLTL